MIFAGFLRAKKEFYKVRKAAKIKYRYNQVPHLTQDTTWESDKIQLNITNESREPNLALNLFVPLCYNASTLGAMDWPGIYNFPYPTHLFLERPTKWKEG